MKIFSDKLPMQCDKNEKGLRNDNVMTPKGKPYKLLNLPYFLGAWIDKYIEWFLKVA
jgi:hypothetical protein